jgi:hypothetical protein
VDVEIDFNGETVDKVKFLGIIDTFPKEVVLEGSVEAAFLGAPTGAPTNPPTGAPRNAASTEPSRTTSLGKVSMIPRNFTLSTVSPLKSISTSTKVTTIGEESISEPQSQQFDRQQSTPAMPSSSSEHGL